MSEQVCPRSNEKIERKMVTIHVLLCFTVALAKRVDVDWGVDPITIKIPHIRRDPYPSTTKTIDVVRILVLLARDITSTYAGYPHYCHTIYTMRVPDSS